MTTPIGLTQSTTATPWTYWPIYPQFLRDLFVRSFTDGLRDPQHGRVKETEWRAAMIRLRDAIDYCPHCTVENFCDSDPADAGKAAPALLLGMPQGCAAATSAVSRAPVGGRAQSRHTAVSAPLLNGRTYDFSQPLAEVSRHPATRSIWG